MSALSTLLALLMPACQAVDSSSPRVSTPTADQVQGLERLLKRPAYLSSVKSDSSGAESVELPTGFNSVVMVQRHPDGSHSAICTDSLQQATEFLTGTPRKSVEYE